MKKVIIHIGLLICLVSFSSYINVHESIKPKSLASIIGKWKLIDAFTKDTDDELSDCEKKQTIEFLSNEGTMVSELIEPCHYDSFEFQYTLKENKLALSFANGFDLPIYGGEATEVPYKINAAINVLDSKNLEFTITSEGKDKISKNEQWTLIYSKEEQ